MPKTHRCCSLLRVCSAVPLLIAVGPVILGARRVGAEPRETPSAETEPKQTRSSPPRDDVRAPASDSGPEAESPTDAAALLVPQQESPSLAPPDGPGSRDDVPAPTLEGDPSDRNEPSPEAVAATAREAAPAPAREARSEIDVHLVLALTRAATEPSPAPTRSAIQAPHRRVILGVPADMAAIAPSGDGGSQVKRRVLATQLDVGVPDGVMVGAAYRPYRWLNLQVSTGTNGISAGIRGGMVLVPLGSGPALALQGGRYFDGNASAMISTFAGPRYGETPVASQIGYQFATARLGWQLGQRRFAAFANGGVSYVRSKLHRVDESLNDQAVFSENGSTRVSFGEDPVVTAWVPSVNLGLLFYFA